MLLVQDSMTREVVTLTPEATAGEALVLCTELRIRHLPILREDQLVGIVSDRDLRSAIPALGDPARAEALARVVVQDVMGREVATSRPGDPIEVAANAMREKKIGCLPVVDENAVLVGIVTSSDVMEALVYLMGAHEPGNRLEVVMPDRPGTLAGVAGIFGELGINIVSVVAGPRQPLHGDDPGRVAVFRVDTMDLRSAVEVLQSAGYEILWPPEP